MQASTALHQVGKVARRSAKAARLLGPGLWRQGLRQGVAATIEHDRLPLMRDYRTVIDVGANKGQFTLYARYRFPHAKVYSIEPLAGPRGKIHRLFGNDSQVEILGFAAGSEAGSATIDVASSDDSSSLLHQTSLQAERFPGTGVSGTEEVEVRTLDDVLSSEQLPGPVLLKIDVQGFEIEVLKGSKAILNQVDTILVEASFVEFYGGQPLFEQVYGFLSEHNFRLTGGAVSSSADKLWEQGDFVFQRRDSRLPAS